MNVDTRRAYEKLLNSRFAYVSVSRARYKAKISADDAQAIGVEISREASKRAAIEYRQEYDQTQRKQPAHQQSHDFGLSLSSSISSSVRRPGGTENAQG